MVVCLLKKRFFYFSNGQAVLGRVICSVWTRLRKFNPQSFSILPESVRTFFFKDRHASDQTVGHPLRARPRGEQHRREQRLQDFPNPRSTTTIWRCLLDHWPCPGSVPSKGNTDPGYPEVSVALQIFYLFQCNVLFCKVNLFFSYKWDQTRPHVFIFFLFT